MRLRRLQGVKVVYQGLLLYGETQKVYPLLLHQQLENFYGAGPAEDEQVLTEPEEGDDDAVEGEHPFVGHPRLLTPGMGQLSERYLLLITNVRPNTEEEVRKGYTIVFKETSFLEEWPGTPAAYCAEVTGRMNEMMSARVVHR